MKELKKIIEDPDRLKFAGDFDNKYLSDGLEHIYGKGDALVFPISTKEVSEILRYANDNNILITPREEERPSKEDQ